MLLQTAVISFIVLSLLVLFGHLCCLLCHCGTNSYLVTASLQIVIK